MVDEEDGRREAAAKWGACIFAPILAAPSTAQRTDTPYRRLTHVILIVAEHVIGQWLSLVFGSNSAINGSNFGLDYKH